MRIIRGRIDGDKLRLNSKVLGYTGNSDAAEIRVDVSPWEKEAHGFSYNLVLHRDSPISIPMQVEGKRSIARARIKEAFDQSGTFTVRLQASRKGRVIHSARTDMQILANPTTPEISIAREGNEISEISLRIPKTSIKDKKRNFVFAHIDKDDRIKSTRLTADHEDANNVYYIFAPISQPGEDGEATIQFSMESPDDTVWQSQEYLFLSDEIPSEKSSQSSVVAYITSDGHFETKEDSADPPVKVHDREVYIPKDCAEIAVQGDRNAEIVTFECDRYYDGWDLSNKRWYIEVFNAGKVYDIVSPVYFEVRDTSIVSVWLVNARHAEYDGNVQVRLRATDGVGYVWQTHTGVFTVYKTFLQIEPPSEPGLSYFDEQIAKVQSLVDEAKTSAEKSEGSARNSPFPNKETNTWMIWDADVYGHVDSGAQVTGDQGIGGTTEIVEIRTGEEGSLATIEETEDSTPQARKYIVTIPAGKTGMGLIILGLYPDVSTLIDAHAEGNPGDAYAIGTDADNTIYLWHADGGLWVNIGKLQGPQGLIGEKGEKGDKGPQGPPGNLQYATFEVDFETRQLVMITPEGYEGVDWRIDPETRELEWGINTDIKPGQIGEQTGAIRTPLGGVILRPRGLYAETETYDRMDVVLHGSNSYVCINPIAGIAPGNTEYWLPLTNVPEGVDLSALAEVARTGSYNNLIDTPEIPSALSELTNDAGFQTAEQVQGAVTEAVADAVGDITGFSAEVAEVLPETGEQGVIYLVENASGENNYYDEYIWIGGQFERIGSTEVDLSGYVPVTRKVAGKPLDADITLSASDVDAVPTTRTVNGQSLSADITLNAESVNAVPATRTVNSKALSADVVLSASDVGAVATSQIIITTTAPTEGSALAANTIVYVV